MMKTMAIEKLSDLSEEKNPLTYIELPVPDPGPGEVLIKVLTCAVCHTELDEIEGRTPPSSFPMVPGHQVVGRVVKTGSEVTRLRKGERVGVAWIYSSCGHCRHCLEGNENLCSEFKATGRDANGGYAEFMAINEDFAHPIPEIFTDEEAAPLLCAGAIGYRSLRLTGIPGAVEKDQDNPGMTNVRRLGLTGFGASAHLVLKMVTYLHSQWKVYVFARNEKERAFALELGAHWSGDTTDEPGVKLDAIIDTTPVWKPVVEAMKNLAPGGRLVINAIRKEDIDKEYLLEMGYDSHLWMEKEIKSVANVALDDVRGLLKLAAEVPIRPDIEVYNLQDANLALIELKEQKIRGAKVLRIPE